VLRAGATEMVTAPLVQGQDEINSQTLDAIIVTTTRNLAIGLHECGAEPPLAIMVSLIGVKGRTIVAGFPGWARLDHNPKSALIDRDQLHCTEVILDDVACEYRDCGERLRQALDQLANAAGRQSSASFDQSGNFTLPLSGHF
jgi:hypothetical protein